MPADDRRRAQARRAAGSAELRASAASGASTRRRRRFIYTRCRRNRSEGRASPVARPCTRKLAASRTCRNNFPRYSPSPRTRSLDNPCNPAERRCCRSSIQVACSPVGIERPRNTAGLVGNHRLSDTRSVERTRTSGMRCVAEHELGTSTGNSADSSTAASRMEHKLQRHTTLPCCNRCRLCTAVGTHTRCSHWRHAWS